MIFTKKVLAFLVIFFPLFILSPAVELNFKLSGGKSYFNMNNINRLLYDYVEWHKKEAERFKVWEFLEGEPQELHWGYDFEGELMLSINRYFSVSLSAGYMYANMSAEKTRVTFQKKLTTNHYVHPINLNAYPVTFSGYGILPLHERLDLYARAGTGIIWTKYVQRNGNKKVEEETYKYSKPIAASGRGPTYSGSIGIIFRVEQGIQIFLEGGFRSAKISGMEGINLAEDEGTLYSYEEYDPSTDFWQFQMYVWPEKPSGENYKSVEESVIDLGGFSIKIGIIIKL